MKTATKHTGRKPATTSTANAACTRCGRRSNSSSGTVPYLPFAPLKDFDPVLSRYYESGGQ